ncbi:MAG: hypothetical protein HC772_15540 [Leptolyngbyaceae cyanobacterium CRU_2_3]|nr:hypothetical protein [Leptolyngbyaceae cyanobacterium CRU_2_3]
MPTSSPYSVLAKRFKSSVTSLLLSTGLAIAGLAAIPAYAGTQTTPERPSSDVPASPSSPLANGTYLYGQSATAEQIGSAYMVFEVNQGKVIGAFYMPRSSFDCFYGSLEADQVALTIVDSYEQSLRPYAVALETTSPVAMAGNETIAPIGLEGFHQISTLSTNDQRILSTCKANYRVRI